MHLYGDVQAQSNNMESFTRRPAFGLTVMLPIIAPGFCKPPRGWLWQQWYRRLNVKDGSIRRRSIANNANNACYDKLISWHTQCREKNPD